MTSHYLECIIADSFNSVFDALSDRFGDIYARKHGKPGELRMGVIMGEHYFFRVESDAAILIILKELASNKTSAEVVSCAGGHGLLEVSYGAHADYVHEVIDFLSSSGFQIEIKDEIEYFDREKCSQLGE